MIRRLLPALAFSLFSASLPALNLPKAPGKVPLPSAEVTRFALDSISLRDVTFVFDLSVKNPYPVSLAFGGMSLAFTVEGAKVFTVASKGGFSVPAKKEKSNTFTVTLTYESIIKLVQDYSSHDWLNTVIDGTLVIPLPKLPGVPHEATFKYSFSKKIPAIKPNVALTEFRVQPPTREAIEAAVARTGKKTDPGKALGVFKSILSGKKPAEPVIDPADLDVPLTVTFTLAIGNEAKGPVSFDKLGYELSVNGQRLVVGETGAIVREAGRDLISVSNTFSSAGLSREVTALFTEKKGTFAVTGSASIKLPDEICKEPIPLRFAESGSFAL